jgi:hypothetical protein
MQQPFYRKHPGIFIGAVLSFFILALLFAADKFIGYREFKAKQKETAGKDNSLISIDGPIKKIIRFRDLTPMLSGFVKPTDEYLQGTDNLERKKYAYRVDSFGFLQPSKVFANSDLQIVFVGGSTTECLFVDEDKRFPSLSAKLLSEKSGKKVNGYNNGFSGNNSMNINNLLINKIIPLHPDYIVFMENINDLNTLIYEGTYWNRNVTRSLTLDSALMSEYNRYFPAVNGGTQQCHSFSEYFFPHIKQRITTAITLFKKRNSKIESKSEWAQSPEKVVIDSAMLCNNFKSSLQCFIKVCKAWNIKPVLMTQQNRLGSSPDDKILNSMKRLIEKGVTYEQYRQLYIQFESIIRQTAVEEKIPCIDLDVRIPKTKEYIYDVVHLNNNGSVLAAQVISNELNDIIKVNNK